MIGVVGDDSRFALETKLDPKGVCKDEDFLAENKV